MQAAVQSRLNGTPTDGSCNGHDRPHTWTRPAREQHPFEHQPPTTCHNQQWLAACFVNQTLAGSKYLKPKRTTVDQKLQQEPTSLLNPAKASEVPKVARQCCTTAKQHTSGARRAPSQKGVGPDTQAHHNQQNLEGTTQILKASKHQPLQDVLPVQSQRCNSGS